MPAAESAPPSRRYARPGIQLAFGGRDPGRLAATAAACRQAGAPVAVDPIDVTDRRAMADWISGVDGEAPLDLMIANAGTSGRHLPEGPERTRAIFAVNLDGVLNTIEPAAAAMVRRASGHLALMSSLASFYGAPSSGAYCASKAAGAPAWREPAPAPCARRRGGLGDLSRFVRTPMNAGIRPRLPLTMSAERAAAIIERGLARGKARIAFPLPAYVAARLLAALPPDLAGRLTARRSG